jgi:hypothetical protein
LASNQLGRALEVALEALADAGGGPVPRKASEVLLAAGDIGALMGACRAITDPAARLLALAHLAADCRSQGRDGDARWAAAEAVASIEALRESLSANCTEAVEAAATVLNDLGQPRDALRVFGLLAGMPPSQSLLTRLRNRFVSAPAKPVEITAGSSPYLLAGIRNARVRQRLTAPLMCTIAMLGETTQAVELARGLKEEDRGRALAIAARHLSPGKLEPA